MSKYHIVGNLVLMKWGFYRVSRLECMFIFLNLNRHVLIDVSLTVKAATFIFIYGRGSDI